MLRTALARSTPTLTSATVRGPAVAPAYALRPYSTEGEQDVVIIGGGPGGYVAAIKAAQLGMKVTCVEKRGALGGTCLNVGCIPSKALLHTTHLYELTKKYFGDHGIMVDNPHVDIDKLMSKKESIVTGLTGGIEYLFSKNGVNYVKGHGTITSPNEVSVALNDGGSESISSKNIVIATGSDIMSLPFLPIDEKKVISSTGALSLTEVPKKMIVVGGGVIGLELGSVWNRLGSEVTVVEFLDIIGGAGMDEGIGKEFLRILKKQKMKFKLGTKVTGAEVTDSGVSLTVENVKKGKEEVLDADVCLVSIGRRKYTDNLGLEAVGIELDKQGNVPVNDNFQTSVPSIYAIGDVIRGPMLAHKSEEEGIAVIEHLAGGPVIMHYNAIPSVLYTSPEVAWVGKTEEDLKAEGVDYAVGTFPLAANSRAKTNGEADGSIKFLTDKATDKVLGVHIIAEAAGEMIAEPTMGLTFGASSEDIARTCHAHPTVMEAVKEAAMAAHDKPIHF